MALCAKPYAKHLDNADTTTGLCTSRSVFGAAPKAVGWVLLLVLSAPWHVTCLHPRAQQDTASAHVAMGGLGRCMGGSPVCTRAGKQRRVACLLSEARACAHAPPLNTHTRDWGSACNVFVFAPALGVHLLHCAPAGIQNLTYDECVKACEDARARLSLLDSPKLYHFSDDLKRCVNCGAVCAGVWCGCICECE